MKNPEKDDGDPRNPPKMVVVDLEATCCDEDSVPRQEREIIEIGAVSVVRPITPEEPEDLAVLDEFQCFVRPLRHPRLTAFCMGLTGIRQEDVDRAPPFPEANERFAEWLSAQNPATWGSWGFFDPRQYRNDCRYHQAPLPFLDSISYRNLKEIFMKTFRKPRSTGVTDALEFFGLEFKGRAHRAIDDARNIARIAARLEMPS